MPTIIRDGADWLAGLGTAKSQGTKVFALTGRVVNVGLVEVPMGMTLREIVEDIGGGTLDGRPLKAVQTGGAVRWLRPADLLDTPVDYEALAGVGSIMGSGRHGRDRRQADMVDVARYFMDFCREESCGKCIPCRVGTVQMHLLLTGHERRRAWTSLTGWSVCAMMVEHTSLCGLGQSAPEPGAQHSRYFRNEYLAALQTGPAGRGLPSVTWEAVP